MPFNGHQRIRARIAKRPQRIFPQYFEPEIEYSWTGYVGATRDHTRISTAYSLERLDLDRLQRPRRRPIRHPWR